MDKRIATNGAANRNSQVQPRVWSFLHRFIVAWLVAMVFHGLYAAWHWHVQFRSGRGLFVLSPTGSVWRQSSLRTLTTNWLQESLRAATASVFGLNWAWQSDLVFTIPTLVPAMLVALLTFVLLTRRHGPKIPVDSHCRCRRCQYILAELTIPRCPECGEAI